MPVGRNDPCPCGSGKKYKKCCGAVIPLRAASAAERHCGTCTACCDGWVRGTIEGHEMKPGQPCHFRGQGCCTIYERRPVDPCRNFVCGWLQPQSPFPEEFRPDQLGVLIIPVRWKDKTAYILRSAGRDPDDTLLGWMRDFSRKSGRPFFYEQRGERFGFGPKEFQVEMLARLDHDARLW
jgi:SEC-C motif